MLFNDRKLTGCSRLLAKVIIAVSFLLCTAENAFAAPNLVLTNSFSPAETGRTYMDIGGTWNGATLVTIGDGFTLTVENTSAGPTPLDDAYDIRDIPVTVPAGFVLASPTVTVTDAGGGCPNMSASASQAGGAGMDVILNIEDNGITVIRPGCTYNYTFRLETNTSAAAGPQSLGYTVTYNTVDNNPGTVDSEIDSQNIDVNAGAILLSKTTAESFPPDATTVNFNVEIENTGAGRLFDVNLTDVLGTGLTGLVITPQVPPPGTVVISSTQYHIGPGDTLNVNVQATTNYSLASATCPTLSNTASITDRTGIVVPDSTAAILFDLGALSISHLGTSRCVLCGTGTVTLRLTNASGVAVDNIVITEDLLTSELGVLTGSSTFGGAGIANPTPAGTQYTWTLPVAQTVPAGGSVDLVFDVAYDTATFGINEDLARNNTAISASVDYELSCGVTQPTETTGIFALTLDQPLPQVTKEARNVDAGQPDTAYAPTVFGHAGDDVIWRVRIQNNGPVNMQDVVLDDNITGNFDIDYVCPTEADASSAAAGAPPGSCVSAGGSTVTAVNNFLMNDPFGVAGSDDVNSAPEFEDIFYVGKIRSSCGVETNNNNIEWGCDVDSTVGGLNSAALFTGVTLDNASAILSSRGVGAGAGVIDASSVTHTITGTDGGPDVGSRGIVTITVNNDTGGTVRGIVIDDVLPASYVVDNTAPITYDFNPAFAVAYGGAADEMTHNIDLTPANLLTNTAPQFVITSNGDKGADLSRDFDLFRNGDLFTITYQIVLVDPTRYDLVADLDTSPEINPGDDPDSTFSIPNGLTVTYDNTCTFTGRVVYTDNEIPNYTVDVEDLDVAISDALFILTNDPGTPLDLNVLLTNNGGHTADNYTAYVTLGEAMTAQTPLPAGCSATTNPPFHPTWTDPAAIPASANVFACDRGPIASGVTETITFSVIKAAPGGADDLTFRADVIGEVTLYGDGVTGIPLTLPAPASVPDTTPNLQLANNYTLDAVRSRVLGFNLVKSAWYCAEDVLLQPPPPTDMLSATPGAPVLPLLEGNLNSQIGEDCAYRIESGGWFGFSTPGFALIEVKDVAVTDVLPLGQGLIQYDTTGGKPFNFSNTPGPGIILVDPVTGGADTTPLSTSDITWQFNTGTDPGIKAPDLFFRVDFKTRLLNDNVDLDYALPLAGPNLHGNPSTNIATTSFTAVFQSDPIDSVIQPEIDITVSDAAPNLYPGYPDVGVRRIILTDVEPNLLVTKRVCNEDIHGIGPTGTAADCTNFVPLADDGDTNDSYIYRVTLTNQTSVPIRTPAYNVIATDTLDSSDLMKIADFYSDGLDNDGDGLIDLLDINEGTISENVANGFLPAVITVSHEHSDALLQIDPGPANSVVFYYRVDPDDAIAPLQLLTNTIGTTYDSLEGDTGNQNDPRVTNTNIGSAGSARVYSSIDAIANVRMIPLLAERKQVVARANTSLGSDVVVGEEIQYRLIAQLPVANLSNFKIRDELPEGLSCIEAPDISLEGPDYAAAGFDPGTTISGPIVATCNDSVVEYDFGDQELTMAPGARFPFVVDFIVRVENTGFTNTLPLPTITNGGGAGVDPVTCTGGVAVCYVNETPSAVALNFADVSVTVVEPTIVVTKSFAVANSDAADILTVTVTAENTGTAAAYNLRVLDDLIGSDLTYHIVGGVSGTDPPDTIDTTTLGPNRPIFSWDSTNPDYEILPGAANTKSFTFQVQVDTSAQPLEILDNTIQAKWDSLPGQTTVLNSSGRLDSIGPAGADGGALGLRNGVLPNNPADTINDFETEASDSTSVLPLTMAKTNLTPAVVQTIGAHNNFQVEITLPEGTSNNVVITDNLNFLGVSYALSHNATYDITYDFVGIDTINAVAPTEAAFNSFPAFNATPATDATGNIVWDIGTVVTLTEDDSTVNAINPIIRINYFARVNNDGFTEIGGGDLQNSATLNYQNGEVPATTEVIIDDTPLAVVVESDLTVTRAVTNQTVGKLTTDLPDAGDILEYEITINNGGNSTAFDVNLVETLSSELLFDNTFTVTALIGGVAVALFEDVPTGPLTGPLTWGRDNADNTLDIPALQSLVLTYRTVVQNTTEPNTIISNSVLVDWTSLDNADLSNAFERTGGTCPIIAAPDDYCIAATTIDINTIDANSIVKSVILDTYDTGLSTAVDSTVRIGDTVTYQIDVAIQEGTTESVNIQDVLPAGMAFVDVVSINTDTTADYDPPLAPAPGSNFSYGTLTAASVPAVGATGTVNWNFGTIVNDEAGDATTDTIVIVYRTRVVDNVVGTTIAQQPTTTLTNTVDLTYIDGLGAASPSVPRLTNTSDVFVLQPIMDDLTKSDRDGDPVNDDPVNVATDIINYRLHTCNTTGLAPAYGLLVTDTLPNEYDEGSITTPVVTIGGTVVTEGAANDYVYTPPVRGGDMIFTFSAPVNPGVCVDIDFDIGFYTDFGFGAFENSVTVNEYYSLPPKDAQLYGPLVPALFNLNNPATAFDPPVKVKTSADDAAVGDEVVYTITVPGAASGASIYDVTVSDNLDASLVFVSATDISANAFTLTDTTVVPNQIRLVIDNIPAGQQAIIELRARVDNNASADASINFNNSSSYTYAAASMGGTINVPGSGVTATPLNIVEPALTSSVTATNLTTPGVLPVAGDIIEITAMLNASGGVLADNFSDAFDVSYDETLSLGLAYNAAAPATITGVATPLIAPVITGDGITAVQNLRWSLEDANADIDIPEGNLIPIVITYQVIVLDTVQSNQPLNNNVRIEWTSRDDSVLPQDVNERNGSETPAVNNYFINDAVVPGPTTTSNDTNIIAKSRLLDTFVGAIPNTVRIGDSVEYELRLSVQPGTHPDVVVADTLPTGLAFEEVVTINGDTTAGYTSPVAGPGSNFVYTTITPADIVVTGDPTLTPSTVRFTIGTLVNQSTGDPTTDDLVIIYRARVLNLVHPQIPTTFALTNNVNFNFDTFTGPEVQPSSETISMLQPNLSIMKTAVPMGGVTPTDPLNTIIDADEFIDYTIEITNNGDAIAYDVVLQDAIPVGLRDRAVPITVTSTQLLVAGTILTNLAPVYDSATGIAVWNFDNSGANTYNIPAGDTLRMVYRIQADAALGAGLSMTNTAQVTLYYSFDDEDVPVLGGITGVREIYGPSNISQVPLTTAAPNALLKTNPVPPADLNASIGETITYTVLVPGVIQTTALHDVQIIDDLGLSAADLEFVSVSKVSPGGSWTPTNIGTPTNIIIADTTSGIDIPANEQIEITITVIVRNPPPPLLPVVNVSGLIFDNTATYTFNQVNDDATTVSSGAGNTTPIMTVVEPELNLEKRGPPGTVSFAADIPYTLVVENIGTGPAFDATIIDRLPDVADNPPLTGGTCGISPDITPANFDARITLSASEAVVERALVLGADYTVTYSAAPTCELVITALTPVARIEAGEKFIISYGTKLDAASSSGAMLTNVAGVTRWFSLDTAGAGATGEIREYVRAFTATPTAAIDHEDAVTVTVDAPIVDVQKTVINGTTGQDPGDDATPGDILSYTVIVTNSGVIDATNVTITDAIPLNATYVADTVFLNGSPVNQPDGGISPLTAGIDVSSSDLAPPTPGNGTITVGQIATITFDVLLNAAITSGTVISNQALVDSPATGVLPSDDPNIGGLDDPNIIGDEDPTITTITSAPAYQVQKTSLDVTADPAVLNPGDTLRYTLTVKNIGLEDGVNVLLRDVVPANTTYVAGTTRLNGVVVADVSAGVSALQAGTLINAPENTTAGYLRADTDVAANNVATVTFDVTINLTTVIGTIISNQGFINGEGAGSGVFPQQPSDDPSTPLLVDDPTLDIVGNVPLIDVLKTVSIFLDNGTAGVVDTGDVLRYTITATNSGAIPATGIQLIDAVPADTTYQGGSTTLNGLAVADPALNVSPLITGIDISSSDLPPPLPMAGTLTDGEAAVVTFDVLVNNGTILLPPVAPLPGTIISNQGTVSSNELPDELTDADGNDANGDQPTIVVVGNVQQLAITKQVFVVGGGTALPGGQLEYVIRVTNVGGIAANNVVITDNLDLPIASQMTYVPGSGLLNGLVAGVGFADPILTADYFATYGDLAPAAVTELRFRVLLNSALAIGDNILNIGEVSWNSPAVTLSDSASIDIGGTPGSINLNGEVWHDADLSNDIGASESLLRDWSVQLYRDGSLLATSLTDANGVFRFNGLPPNTPVDPYQLRYRAPDAISTSASLGQTSSAFTNGPQRIDGIFADSGANLLGLNLPRQPNGVVYDSVLRVPVAGVQLTMVNQTRSNQTLPPGCFVDPNHQNQVTLDEGYYKFDLNFSDPNRCAIGDDYEIQVQPPASGFVGTTSVIIPPFIPVTGAAINVPTCPGTGLDQIVATATLCEINASPLPQPASVAARTPETNYYLKLLLNDTTVNSDQAFNNHIAVDSEQPAAVAISKVSGLLNVTRSQLVPYTITISNTLPAKLTDLNLVDNFPAGFKYVTDSARSYYTDAAGVDVVEADEPQIDGRLLTWTDITLEVNETRRIKLLLIVGSGVGEDEYVNTAQVFNLLTGEAFSGVASATVRVIPDPTFDCTDIIGKVFDDKNMNAYQDDGETGLAGVQVATARGLRVTTDAHGRFHITCAVVPNEVRGSNFIMKLDDRTLPSGYRITTENPRVQRATRGKMLKFNFGAAIHRVVRLDLADGVFEKGSTRLRPQWESRIELLITELQKEGSILRLSYLGENESEDEVENRLDAIDELISDRWQELDCCYKLTIEKEVFWRKGSPSDRKRFE